MPGEHPAAPNRCQAKPDPGSGALGGIEEVSAVERLGLAQFDKEERQNELKSGLEIGMASRAIPSLYLDSG